MNINKDKINWDVLAEEKIKEGKAKYIDELVSVTSLDSSMDSLIQKLDSFKKNIIAPSMGIGNLTHVNLGLHLTAFSIDNIKTKGDIYAVDAFGDLIIYDSKNFHTRFTKNKDDKNYNFHKIKVFNLGTITKIGGLSNLTYMEDVGNRMNDVEWKPIELNTSQSTNVLDFTNFSSVNFFAIVTGGILRQTGKIMTDSNFPNKNEIMMSSVKFQAISLDNKNKILYALDRSDKIEPNNLYIIYLDDNLDWVSNNYQIVKSNSKLFFNNLIVLPNNYNNLINSDNKQLILIGTQLDDNNNAVNPGEVNLYSGSIKYGTTDPKIDVFERNTCNVDVNLRETCPGSVSGITKNECLKLDCCYNPTNLGNKIPWCYKSKINPKRSAGLILTKLVKNDFSGKDYLFNRTETGNLLHDLVAENLKNLVDTKINPEPDRFINIDINHSTYEIYLLLDGVLLKYPINPLGNTDGINNYSNLIYNENELNDLENQINLLYDNYKKIAKVENKLDTKLIKERNNLLINKINNLKNEITNLNNIKNENKRFSSEVESSEMQNNSVAFQYMLWIILGIITIILVSINLINPEIIPIPILIIYIVFVAIIMIINRNLLKKI